MVTKYNAYAVKYLNVDSFLIVGYPFLWDLLHTGEIHKFKSFKLQVFYWVNHQMKYTRQVFLIHENKWMDIMNCNLFLPESVIGNLVIPGLYRCCWSLVDGSLQTSGAYQTMPVLILHLARNQVLRLASVD